MERTTEWKKSVKALIYILSLLCGHGVNSPFPGECLPQAQNGFSEAQERALPAIRGFAEGFYCPNWPKLGKADGREPDMARGDARSFSPSLEAVLCNLGRFTPAQIFKVVKILQEVLFKHSVFHL